MYYDDLTEYTYSDIGSLVDLQPGAVVYNVGWLDASMPFVKSDCPCERFLIRRVVGILDEIGVEPLTCKKRGVHNCNIRPCSRIEFGNGEFVVKDPFSKTPVYYVAPRLIKHYMTEHGYVPPFGFIRALLFNRQ